MCVFLRKMSTGFQARHEKSRITKDLHICQRFGAEGAGGEGRRFITFSKVQKLNIGLFWRSLPKFSTEIRRVLTALCRRPLFRSPIGYRRRQQGDGKDTWAATRGTEFRDLTIGATLPGHGSNVKSGSNQWRFLQSPVPFLA